MVLAIAFIVMLPLYQLIGKGILYNIGVCTIVCKFATTAPSFGSYQWYCQSYQECFKGYGMLLRVCDMSGCYIGVMVVLGTYIYILWCVMMCCAILGIFCMCSVTNEVKNKGHIVIPYT